MSGSCYCDANCASNGCVKTYVCIICHNLHCFFLIATAALILRRFASPARDSVGLATLETTLSVFAMELAWSSATAAMISLTFAERETLTYVAKVSVQV